MRRRTSLRICSRKACRRARAVFHRDVVAVEHVEHFEDRIAVAGHRQDAKQLRHGPGRAGDLPSADGVGAIGRAGSPQSLAMSATDSGWPMASPRCSRSLFSSAPVTGSPVQMDNCEVRHTRRLAWGLYQRIRFPDAEASMRRLLESLDPRSTARSTGNGSAACSHFMSC